MADLGILRALSGGATAAASGIENQLIEALNRSDEDRRLQALLESEGRQEVRTIAREDRASLRADEAAHDDASTGLLSLGLGERGLVKALRQAGFAGNVEDASTSQLRSATAAGTTFQDRRIARQTAETEILNELDTNVAKGLVDPVEESRLRLIVAGTKGPKRRKGFNRLNRELTTALGTQARTEAARVRTRQEATDVRAEAGVDISQAKLGLARQRERRLSEPEPPGLPGAPTFGNIQTIRAGVRRERQDLREIASAQPGAVSDEARAAAVEDLETLNEVDEEGNNEVARRVNETRRQQLAARERFKSNARIFDDFTLAEQQVMPLLRDALVQGSVSPETGLPITLAEAKVRAKRLLGNGYTEAVWQDFLRTLPVDAQIE